MGALIGLLAGTGLLLLWQGFTTHQVAPRTRHIGRNGCASDWRKPGSVG